MAVSREKEIRVQGSGFRKKKFPEAVCLYPTWAVRREAVKKILIPERIS
jgi:hypothetical protein